MIAALTDVTKRYGGLTAVNGLTLGLEAGRVTALLGPNGAGKTTAVRMLLGLTRPTSGAATLFGLDPRNPMARQRTGAMLQVAAVPETLRVREHVELFRSYYPHPLSTDETLAVAGLATFADRRYGALSGGQKQRVLFALAICGNPELLFLDEPTVGLDVESRRGFWQEIRRLAADGRAVLLTTHYLEEADALADRIVVIDKGRTVADGAPHEIKSLTSARRIRCVTSCSLDTLAAMAGVQSARRDGASVELLTSDAEGVVRALLAADPALSGLEITGAGLEDAFLALTGGQS